MPRKIANHNQSTGEESRLAKLPFEERGSETSPKVQTKRKHVTDGKPKKNSQESKKPFKARIVDTTQEGHIAFFAFVPREIEEGDFDGKWWPLLTGFPFNIMYSSSYNAGSAEFAIASALYQPDLETFRESKTQRELTYENKHGGPYRVRVVLKKGSGMETSKYRNEKLIALTHGGNFDNTMRQTTMIGIQDDEAVELTRPKMENART